MFWATSYLLFCLSVYSHLLHFAPIVSDSSNFRQAQQTKFVVSKIKQFTARILILFRLGGGGGAWLKCCPLIVTPHIGFLTDAHSRPCLEAIFITKVVYTEPKKSLEYNLHQVLNHGLHIFIVNFYINTEDICM
jgi:hypothetical protein